MHLQRNKRDRAQRALDHLPYSIIRLGRLAVVGAAEAQLNAGLAVGGSIDRERQREPPEGDRIVGVVETS
jgi:hypothetical protein